MWPEFDAGADPDAIVQVAPDGRSLVVVTGVAMGPVELRVAVLPASPADGVAGAGDGTDGDVRTARGELQLDAPLVLTAPTLDTGVVGPVLVPPAPGRYGFQLTAVGRDGHVDEVVETPTESYTLEVWPVD